jgi:hypothetical protein
MSLKFEGNGGGRPGPGVDHARPRYFGSTAYFAASAFILAFASVQSDFDISLKPVPLQLFMPLQLFLADLQSDMPLQEFTPVQCMVAASAATDMVANPEVNNIAAAAAMVALDSLLICMIVSSIVIELNAAILLLPYKDPANVEIITQSSKLMLTSIDAG